MRFIYTAGLLFCFMTSSAQLLHGASRAWAARGSYRSIDYDRRAIDVNSTNGYYTVIFKDSTVSTFYSRIDEYKSAFSCRSQKEEYRDRSFLRRRSV